VDGLAYLASGIGDHPPGQASYLLGSQAGFDRQEEDGPVPGGPTRSGQVAQDGIHLPLAQRLRLFSQSHLVLLTRYLWAAGRWTVTSQERSYIADRKYLSAVQGLGSTDDRRDIRSSVAVHSEDEVVKANPAFDYLIPFTGSWTLRRLPDM